MSEQRENPLSHRMLTVADDGTIPTWVVTWEGDEVVKARSKHFLSESRQERLAILREKYGKQEPEEERKEGLITRRTSCFIHYEDALGEYNWIKRILVERGDWEIQQAHLSISEGERASWAELFEEPGIYNWEA